jgi:uncharacterized protein (UPF0248 family)
MEFELVFFQLVYRAPLNDEVVVVYDPEKVTSVSETGVIITVTKKTSMFIPWHRVLSIVGPSTMLPDMLP